jgi:predicted site-specific integrase-resolvase
MQQQNSIETQKLALNRIEAAKALSVSPATLDRLVKRGLIVPCRATGRPLFAIAEIERFLRETTAEMLNAALNNRRKEEERCKHACR